MNMAVALTGMTNCAAQVQCMDEETTRGTALFVFFSVYFLCIHALFNSDTAGLML